MHRTIPLIVSVFLESKIGASTVNYLLMDVFLSMTGSFQLTEVRDALCFISVCRLLPLDRLF